VAVLRPGETIVLPVWTGAGGKDDYNKQRAQLAPIQKLCSDIASKDY
jgi:hypothetical protein